jgi:hypothetical protein
MARNPEVDKHLEKTFGGTLAKERILRDKRTVPIRGGKPSNYSLVYKPKTDEELLQIAHELFEFVSKEDCTDIDDFPISKRISPYRFKRFQNEFFQETLELSKYIIKSRNQKLVNKRQFDREIFFKYLRLLDRDYKEDEDDRIAKRVAGIKQSLGDITIVDHMLEKE